MRRGFQGLAVLGLVLIAGCKVGGADRGALAPVGEAATDLVHAQCIRSGGEFVHATGGFLCQSVPRDAGKACSSGRDCESACLSRSRSCAPVTPLLGCNEILNDGGVAVTQCIE
ncbi:hypothetical protein [Frigidibacter sp. SD6-1]|uniref:hypothetical protein n=1 Tax=Frigidibacter sp. SD6-1 TaxID=3032581 RepID=UPI0024DF97C8|nr:hypothetical protein [Frigidibacter sp. SD6-1]